MKSKGKMTWLPGITMEETETIRNIYNCQDNREALTIMAINSKNFREIQKSIKETVERDVKIKKFRGLY